MKKSLLFLLLVTGVFSYGCGSSTSITSTNTDKMLLTKLESPTNVDWVINKSEEYFLDNGEQLKIYSFMQDIVGNPIDTSNTSWSKDPDTSGTFSVNPGSSTVFSAASSGKYEAVIKATCKSLVKTMKLYIGYSIDSIRFSIFPKNNTVMVIGGDNNLTISATPLSEGKNYNKPVTIDWSVYPNSVVSLSASIGSNTTLTGLSAGTAIVTASINTAYGVIQSTISVQVKDKMVLFNDSYTPDNWYVTASQLSNIGLTLMSGVGGAPMDTSKYLQVEFKTTSSSAKLSYQFPSAQNIMGYTKLYFWAKGSTTNQEFSFSTQGNSKNITLTTDWTLYSLNLGSGINTVSEIFSVSPYFLSQGVIYIDCIYLQ